MATEATLALSFRVLFWKDEESGISYLPLRAAATA